MEGPVKGNVVEHHGLGCIGKRELDYSTLCEADVRAFGATAALDAAPKRPFACLRKMDDLRYSSDGAVSSLPCGEVRELPSSPTTLRLGL